MIFFKITIESQNDKKVVEIVFTENILWKAENYIFGEHGKLDNHIQ